MRNKYIVLKIWYMKQIPILFSHRDFLELYPTPTGFSSFVCRMLKQGRIKQIKRGLYALVDPSTGDIYASCFQIASKLSDGAFFSYHEALTYYGLANQSFVSDFVYLSHAYSRNLDFQGVVYKAKKSDCSIQINDRMKEEGVRVVSLERAIVDSIDCPGLAGGLEEIEYALDNVPKLDVSLVEQMLEHYDKDILYQKVGYLLEKHLGTKIKESFYEKCLSHVKDKTVYFEAKVGHAKLNEKWKLMVDVGGDIPDELF